MKLDGSEARTKPVAPFKIDRNILVTSIWARCFEFFVAAKNEWETFEWLLPFNSSLGMKNCACASRLRYLAAIVLGDGAVGVVAGRGAALQQWELRRECVRSGRR